MTWASRLVMMVGFGVFAFGPVRVAEAQLGSLLSPGRLTKPHTKLEGLDNCTQCHERGRGVSAPKCLTCHKPVAERIAQKVGVHRDVTNDCVQCHVEHSGIDGELRPFDPTAFDHATDTRYPLDGEHAASSIRCESCHKTRSYLAVKTTCVSCHDDVHKGELGLTCENCHTTKTAFTTASKTFNHGRTRFPLTGAHASATCASCHKTPSYSNVPFASCASCHKSPHTPALPGTCSSCHGTETWRTRTFDHSRTDFPLAGQHAKTSCAGCHKGSALATPVSTSCASCHTDPHRGEFTEDCGSCHTETNFTGGTFDHSTTPFSLTEGHANLKCVSCHKAIVTGVPTARAVADFRGLTSECASCHGDPHDADLGTDCTSCHSASTFTMTSFSHPRAQHLFEGAHLTVACEACHAPAPLARTARSVMAGGTFTTTPAECASCHRDVHLGQVASDCLGCHSVSATDFVADRFSHDRATFRLTGAHATVECLACHKTETAAFPAGAGTTMRLTGIATACRTCHEDVHLGQVSSDCETCHDTAEFAVKTYVHKARNPDFFTGPHLTAECAACHKPVTGRFPSGTGTAVEFKVKTACVSCHTDVHRGAMGNDCRACHKVARLRSSHNRSTASEHLVLAAVHGGITP